MTPDESTSSGPEVTSDVAAGVRVVAGSPTPEDLAAVIAVLQAQADERDAQGHTRVEQSPRAGWDASARGLRAPLSHGRGAWTRSLR